MTRVMLLAVTLLLSVSAAIAAAQPVKTGGEQSPTPVFAVAISDAAALPALADVSTPVQPPPRPQPPPDANGPRRRGSMVGYIEDPVIGSKVRLRFDLGFHTDTPDRAEFFYAKCGCYRDLFGNAAFDPDSPGPGPGIVSDLNFQQFYVLGEWARTDKLSIFAELPVRSLQPKTPGTFANQRGIGDLRAGVKLALSETPDHMVTAQVKAYLPTGDALRGLGTDHASIEPAILFYQRMSDVTTIEAQFGVWIPIGGSNGVPITVKDKFAGSVLSYGIGPSFELYRSGDVRFAPVIELVGWRVLSGFQTATVGDASGTNIVNLKLGGRVSWGSNGSFYVGYGHALTDAVWYDDILRFEYRFGF
jgi:hypothetical protein